MATLSPELRKRLENVVTEARDVGEKAAMKALRALAVSDREPHGSMSSEQKALRNRLRTHGRQLGDFRNIEKGTQNLDHLLTECAYEQWHRMLFARFLAENQLLLEPASGVAIAIEEVKELARSRGKDWVTLAGEFAVRMLPQVFRQGDPGLEVQFAPEDRKRLEELLESLPYEVFSATDSLGWTYQFWQAERKDTINASGDKIGADELPAVTQLFTEDYMVDFLLDNTLGAWHAGKILLANPKLGEDAKSEEELRKAMRLPGSPWNYLRFVKSKDGAWAPGAGAFNGWPKVAKEVKCLDPCMGSGHFVVAMFERLIALRMAEEGLDEVTAVTAVIRDNLFGLEIDPRCTQIAAFNLALAAWRRVGHQPLPAMNLACSGVAPNAPKADWLKLAGGSERLRRGMERLYSLFADAPVLGSLIDPRSAQGDLLVAEFQELQPLLEKALARDAANETSHEMAITARGLAKAAELLAAQFNLVATNVPFLTQIKFASKLQEFVADRFPSGKGNLATAFIVRMTDIVSPGGHLAFVSPQSWWFLKRYEAVRRDLLTLSRLDVVVRLGENAFVSPQAGGELVGLSIVADVAPTASDVTLACDVSSNLSPAAKAVAIASAGFSPILQLEQLSNPDAVILFSRRQGAPELGQRATALRGVGTGDSAHFVRSLWEVPFTGHVWEFHQTTVSNTQDYGGMCEIILWEEERGELAALAESVRLLNHAAQNWRRGKPNWGKRGVVVSQMGELTASLYTGAIYDPNCCAIVPADGEDVAALWAFCSSSEFRKLVRQINQNRKVEVRTLLSVPFDLMYWQKVAAEKYPHGLPTPYSSDPTQWLFNGHPTDSDEPLQVAVARLLGYQWPRQTGSSFPDCGALGPDGLEKLAEDDGIVCLSATKGEAPADERLREVLARAYGKEWDAAVLEQLLAQVGFSGKTLADWLRDGFFEQHCALFHQRPFIWHIWDGERDGFHALVNYHKLTAPDAEGRKTLEKLTYSYLGDWITRQKAEQKQGKEGADAKLAAALHLQEELKKILEGEPPYDLFVRWKPLHEQALGWEPDINDGVRMNIRPFMSAETLKGKSIFRKAPKIKWDKDRGKEPNRSKRDFPWFWSWDEEAADFKGGPGFDGNRWNDLHYGNEMKEAALTGAEKKR